MILLFAMPCIEASGVMISLVSVADPEGNSFCGTRQAC